MYIHRSVDIIEIEIRILIQNCLSIYKNGQNKIINIIIANE